MSNTDGVLRDLLPLLLHAYSAACCCSRQVLLQLLMHVTDYCYHGM